MRAMRQPQALAAKAIALARALAAAAARFLAEQRRHRAAIEKELFAGRYRLVSKNDDDLPIAR